MYTVANYCRMVGDKIRTVAYQEVLRQAVTSESVVLDVGTESASSPFSPVNTALAKSMPWNLFQRHIPSIIDARKRLLRDDAVLIPVRDTIMAAIVHAPTLTTITRAHGASLSASNWN